MKPSPCGGSRGPRVHRPSEGAGGGRAVPDRRGRLAYLLASGAAVLLPTPGGLGSLDAALVLTLSAAGVPGAAALSPVFGYRLLTAWLSLSPGLLVLVLLVRRSVL